VFTKLHTYVPRRPMRAGKCWRIIFRRRSTNPPLPELLQVGIGGWGMLVSSRALFVPRTCLLAVAVDVN
jgi:hypothetical protein